MTTMETTTVVATLDHTAEVGSRPPQLAYTTRKSPCTPPGNPTSTAG
jgi:hypothetical protein